MKHHVPRFAHSFIGTIPWTFTQLFRIFGQLQIPWREVGGHSKTHWKDCHNFTSDGSDIQNQPVMNENPVNSVINWLKFFHQRKDTIMKPLDFLGKVFLLREIQTESCFLYILRPFRQIWRLMTRTFWQTTKCGVSIHLAKCDETLATFLESLEWHVLTPPMVNLMPIKV